jgi:predicted enzyme involved in methoxymalonyl-ACP biosynthesis
VLTLLQAMARDLKLNVYQHSVGQIRSRVLKYKKTLDRAQREAEEAMAAAAAAEEQAGELEEDTVEAMEGDDDGDDDNEEEED